MRQGAMIALVALFAFTAGWWIGRTTALDTDGATRLAVVERGLADLKDAVDRLAVSGPLPPQQGPDPAQVYDIDTAGSPAIGPPDAPVTIVEFSDFECPFCASANLTIERVVENYAGQVQRIFKHNPLPIHGRALLAHKAAVAAAAQGRFWEMHDRLFAFQDQLDSDSLREHARSLDLDLDDFEAALESAEAEALVKADMAEATRIPVMGVPSFFINGRYLPGAQPYEVFRQRVEAELEKK